MFKNILQSKTSLEKDQNTGYFILKQLDRYLSELLVNLDAQIDKRLVRTFYNLCAVIIMFRNRSMGLLLQMVCNWGAITQLLFRWWCHRTGERY